MIANVHDKLSKKIFSEKEFFRDYKQLLEGHFTGSKNLTIEALKRLLKVAGIFTSSSEIEENSIYKKMGYKIAVYILEDYKDQYSGLMKIAQNLLIRLGNFPAIQKCVKDLNGKDYYSVINFKGEVFNPIIERDILIKQCSNIFSTQQTRDKQLDFFTNFQAKVYKHLLEGKSITYSAPTSAGKSFLLTHYISKRFMDSKRNIVVYIVPTRALINQVQIDFLAQFNRLGINDIVTYTSYIPVSENPLIIPSKILFVLTQERYKNLLTETSVRPDILVVDEAQKISNDTRGILLEEVIMATHEENLDVQFIFLSPYAKNPDKLSNIIKLKNVEKEKTSISPVSQNKIFINISDGKASSFLAFPEKEEKIHLSTVKCPVLDSDELKIIWVAKKFGSESNIIFCDNPAKCKNIAKLLISNDLEAVVQTDEIKNAIEFLKEYIHPEYHLIDYLSKGIAYHHGKMPHLVRLVVEDLFKNKKLKYICCTHTLLEGVNLPAQSIFLYNPRSNRSGMNELDFLNLSGRAGRLLKDFYGNIYCINVDEWSGYKPDEKEIGEHEITSAFENVIKDSNKKIIDYLNDLYVTLRATKKQKECVEAVTTRFIIKQLKQGKMDSFLKSLVDRNDQLELFELENIRDAVIKVSKEIDIPYEILEKNSDVDPRKQKELLDKIELNEFPIPLHPSNKDFYRNFKELFKSIAVFFLGASPNNINQLFNLATYWIKEKSLAEIIKLRLDARKYASGNELTKEQINQSIEKVLTQLESDIRYKYLRFIKCYISLLTYYYDKQGKDIGSIASRLPNYLEFGCYKPATLMLQQIGVSRGTAIMIANNFKLTFQSMEHCREWLLEHLDDISNDLPAIAVRELTKVVGR